jgi:hypothetical protein
MVKRVVVGSPDSSYSRALIDPESWEKVLFEGELRFFGGSFCLRGLADPKEMANGIRG